VAQEVLTSGVERSVIMIYWTPKMVDAQLTKTVAALGQQGSGTEQPPCPSSPEGALLWLLWLEPEDAELLWMRVDSRPWKEICRYFGISRATANRRVEYVLSVIAWKLNHQHLPLTWSCRYLVERTRAVSRDV
jgi:hypothetical protein